MRYRLLRTLALGVVLLVLSCGAPARSSAPRPPARKAPVELTASVDKASVNPGDIVTFSLIADYARDVAVELPEIADKFPDLHIVNSGVSPPAGKGDRLVAERWYKLQPDTAGSYVVDSIEVNYRLPDGSQQTARTPKIFIEVVSLLGKNGGAQDIRDIKPPLTVSPPYALILAIMGALAAAALLAMAGRRLLKRLRKREQQRVSPRPPHEEALEALEQLLAKGLLEKGRMREFCFEISEIFRRYLQARFGIPAIDLTTEEILPHVEGNGILDERLKPLARDFLGGTDLVKFAKHRPTREEMEGIIARARTFIDGTKSAAATDAEEPVGKTGVPATEGETR